MPVDQKRVRVSPGWERWLICGRRLVWAGVASVVGVAAAVTGESVARAELRVGAAEVEITPPVGFPMAGYYHERLATGAKDPLKAKALVFRDGETRAAVVACDLTGIATDLTAEVRERIARATGIPGEAVTVCGTHSHTAPDYGRDLYEHVSELRGGTPPAQPRYTATLIEAIAKAVIDADRAAVPAVLSRAEVIQETPVSFNRRFVMRDGTVKTWQSHANPEVVRAAGPIDPAVGVVVARPAAGGAPLATFTNFALHLDTVGGLEWSADYPYFIEESVRGALGNGVVSVFGLGCCGDINHSNPRSTVRNKTDFIGKALGATVVGALPRVRPVKNPRLRSFSETVLLPLQAPSVAEVQAARGLLTAVQGGQNAEFFAQVTAYKQVMIDQLREKQPTEAPGRWLKWGLTHRLAGVGDALPVEVRVIALADDLALVFLPGEVFVELGLAIRQGSPFDQTLVVELSNAVETIYIPNRGAYAQGGYEVTNSALQPGGGEMLVEAALRLLAKAAQQR